MDSITTNLKRKIVNARNAIRRKYKALKLQRSEHEKFRADAYKPIIDPLANIVTKFDDVLTTTTAAAAAVAKKEKSIGGTKYELPLGQSTPFHNRTIQRAQETLDRYRGELFPTRYTSPVDESPGATPTFQIEEIDDPLPRKYFKRIFEDANDSVDFTYGIHWNVERGTWQMGNATVRINGKDIVIDDERQYDGTNGLYELIIMKKPVLSEISGRDRRMYYNILMQTNAHRNESNDGIKAPRSGKYKKIIKPILNEFNLPTAEGSGMLFKEIDLGKGEDNERYRYWNDIHELLDELQLLWAEKIAGNTGHRNQIISILEELYEEGYIKSIPNI